MVPTNCSLSFALSHASVTYSNTSCVEYPLRKPDYLFEKDHVLLVKWLTTWLKTTFSSTFEKTGKIEIGWKLDNEELCFDFWTGTTIAFFQISGKVCDVLLLVIRLVQLHKNNFGLKQLSTTIKTFHYCDTGV